MMLHKQIYVKAIIPIFYGTLNSQNNGYGQNPNFVNVLLPLMQEYRFAIKKILKKYLSAFAFIFIFINTHICLDVLSLTTSIKL